MFRNSKPANTSTRGRIAVLKLGAGNGALLAANYHGRTDQKAEIINTDIPSSNDMESAIVRNLAPGNYTAIVRGVDNTTGVALVEAYGLNGPVSHLTCE